MSDTATGSTDYYVVVEGYDSSTNGYLIGFEVQ